MMPPHHWHWRGRKITILILATMTTMTTVVAGAAQWTCWRMMTTTMMAMMRRITMARIPSSSSINMIGMLTLANLSLSSNHPCRQSHRQRRPSIGSPNLVPRRAVQSYACIYWQMPLPPSTLLILQIMLVQQFVENPWKMDGVRRLFIHILCQAVVPTMDRLAIRRSRRNVDE